ncbi:major capsid pentamer protein [Gordonia phage Evaa]|nr:major capsid pentamer protein [Gordonia phage Evaa]
MTTPVTTPDLLAVVHDPPLVNPSPQGLYAATTWHEETGALRWLANGVRFRPRNYGGETAFGIWGAGWCEDPDPSQVKEGTRPDEADPFDPITAWAYDDCDLTQGSRAEVRERVQQTFRLVEQTAVEREFAAQLLADAPAGPTSDLIAAVAHLEAQLAKTNTVGFIHASAQAAALAQHEGLIVRTGGGLKTPLGHTWVFGGGYVDGLGATLVATSPTEGWRSDVEVREAVAHEINRFIAVAERHVVVGYEKAIARATIGA